jgi:hypothetical protein
MQQGETAMKSLNIAGALAIALTLGSAAALAQTVGDGKNSVTPPNSYSVGNGAAHIGDGTNTKLIPDQYSAGNGAAHIGDGTNTKLVPDQYSAGNGASGQDAQKRYVAGRTAAQQGTANQGNK